MKKFFRSKFFYLITFLTLAAVIIPSVLTYVGAGYAVKNVINTILTPARVVVLKAADAIDGFASYFTDYDELKQTVTELQRENKELKEKLDMSSELESQYKWLSDFLDIKMQNDTFSLVSSTVCGRESTNYSKTYIIDKGTSSGIQTNMPVISSGGLLGYISDVGANWATVTSVSYTGTSIGVYDERSNATGVMSGEYELSKTGDSIVKYIPADEDIQIGDRILTSGYGSIYPRGLLVGYVSAINTDIYSRNISVIVKLSAFSDEASDSITKVMVITGYTDDAGE